MSSIEEISFKQRIITYLLVLSVTLIAFFSYKDMLSYFFTSGETLTLIEKSRIHSVNDLIRILTDDLMSGTTFKGHLYRPVMVFSFSMDYAIWKLNPFGYHLTDLIIHILVANLVFFFVQMLTGGKKFAAWLSAITFSIHPIIMRAVIGIDKRNDSLAALFFMLSLLTFLKYLSSTSKSFKKSFLFASVFFYAVAFGSKEIAVILPLVVFSYLIFFSDEISFKVKVIEAIKKAAPYFIMTVVLIAWRAYILKHLVGGYSEARGVPMDIIILTYFNNLLNPAGFVTIFVPAVYTNKLCVLSFIPVVISLLFYKHIISGNMGIRIVKILFLTGLILSAISICSYPVLLPFIENSYQAKGLQFFINVTGIANPSMHRYLGGMESLYVNLFCISLVFFTICLVAFVFISRKREYFLPASHEGKILAFLFTWLLLPLCIYLTVLSLAPWQMYIPLIPYSIILSITFTESIRSCKICSPSSRVSRLAVPAVSGILLTLIILYSTFTGFGDTGAVKMQTREKTKAREMLLRALLETVPKLPNTVNNIILTDLPDNFWVPDYYVKSWLDLNYPSNSIKRIVTPPDTLPEIKTIPDCLDFEIQFAGKDEKIDVILKPKPCSKQ